MTPFMMGGAKAEKGGDMKEHPILFSDPMVRAILDGRKTVTRRVVKPQPKRIHWLGENGGRTFLDCERLFRNRKAEELGRIYCPCGAPGDRLWVREAWRPCGDDEMSAEAVQALRPSIAYRADEPWDKESKWRPSIHMPKWASRITLEVTDIRVERLQEIAEEEALAEGVAEWMKTDAFKGLAYNDPHPGARGVFAQGWDALNAKRGYGWDVDPWVWIVSFRRETPQGGPHA